MASSIPNTMRAWQFSQSSGGIDKNLTLTNSTQLPPKSKSLGPNDILVQVSHSALNPVDYKMAEIPLARMLLYGAPATPGIDFAGRVVATGSPSPSSTSQDLKPGQLVFGRLGVPTKFGTMAEYTIVPRDGCAVVPEGVPSESAASIGTAGLTAYQSIVPYVDSGDRVFINGGSGGVGIFCIQIAKAVGCHIVTSCSGVNAELCRSLGADEVIDYRTEDVLKVLKDKSNFDLVVDNVGGPGEMYWDAHSFMKAKGQIVQVGAAVGLGVLYQIMSRMLWPGLLGGIKRGYSVLMLKNDASQLKQLAQWMQEGKMKAVIDEVFDMEDKGAVKAYQKLKTGRAKGKILVRIGS
ncbi:hypothetical protein ACLMJK_004619 [Lecanora helva]